MTRRLMVALLAGVLVLAGLEAPSARAASLSVDLSSNGTTAGLSEWAVGVGQSTGTFYALVSGGSASAFRWWTEDTGVATVSASGGTATVTGVGEGATKLWVEARGGGETVTDWAWMSVGANVPDTLGPVVKSGAALYRSRTTASAFRGVLASAVTGALVTHTSGSWVRVTFPADFVFSDDDAWATRAAWVLKSSVDIPPSSVTMSPGTLIVEKGRTGSLSAATLQSYANDVRVSWSSAAAGTATVSNTGVVSGVGEGVTSVTVAAASSHGVRLTDTATVSVYTPMTAVSATARLAVGARSVADGTSAVVVSLTAGGAVSVLGVCGSYFLVESAGKRGFVPITAIRMPPPVVTLDKTAADVEIGATVSLSVSAGASYRWWSDDTSVATVSGSGGAVTVSGRGQGVAQVWVELTDRWGSVGTASAWVTVFDDVPDTPGSVVHEGAQAWRSATTDGISRGTLAAEVSGAVTAVAGSWVRLSFPSGFSFPDGQGGSTAWMRKADVDIPPVSVTVDLPTRVVERGGMSQAAVTVDHDYANDVRLSWTSGATGVATVTDAGVIDGVSEGVSVLRVAAASSHGVRLTDTTTVSVYTPDPGVGKLIAAASVRPVADDRSAPVGAAAVGDHVIVLGPCGDYLYIDRDGVRGFVPKSAVAVSAALVSLGAAAVSVRIGAKTVLLATPAEDAADLAYAWSSTDAGLADVAGSARQGTVTGRAEGVTQARVEATDAAGESWPAAAWVSVYTPVALKGKAVIDAGVRESALAESGLVAVIDSGDTVSILGVLGSYYYVRVGDDHGYVDQSAIALAAGKLSVAPTAIAVSTEGVLASVRGSVASGVVATWSWASSDPAIATAESTRPAATATGVAQGVTTLQVTATDATGEVQKATAWVTTYEPFAVTVKGKAISDTDTREAATTDAATWGTVKKAAQVTILGQSGPWWYADIAGTKGFVPKATVIVQVDEVTAAIAVDVPRGGQASTTAEAEPALADVTWAWTSAKTANATVTGGATATVKGIAEGTSQLTAQATDKAGGTAKATVWATTYTPAPGATTGFTSVATAMRYWADPTATPLRQLGKGNQLHILGTAGAFYYARTGNTTGHIAKAAVTIPATAITVNPKTVTVAAGQSATISTTLTPALSTDALTWKVENAGIANVQAGKVNAKNLGSTVVSVGTTSGMLAEVKVIVTPSTPESKPAELPRVVQGNALSITSRGLNDFKFAITALSNADTWKIEASVAGGKWQTTGKSGKFSSAKSKALRTASATIKVQKWWGKSARFRLTAYAGGKVIGAKPTTSATKVGATNITEVGSNNKGQPVVNWIALPGAKGYGVYVKKNTKSAKYALKTTVKDGGKKSATITGLTPGKSYTLKVAAASKCAKKACDYARVGGTAKGAVVYSDARSFTTQVTAEQRRLNAYNAIKRILNDVPKKPKSMGKLLYETDKSIINSVRWTNSSGKATNANPYIKYQWDFDTLVIHSYIRFVDDGQSGDGRTVVASKDGKSSVGPDHQTVVSRSAATNRGLFLAGIADYWSNRVIVGQKDDLGKNLSFRLRWDWHVPGDRRDAASQRYVPIYMGASRGDGKKRCGKILVTGPWYAAVNARFSTQDSFMCMPWEWEIARNWNVGTAAANYKDSRAYSRTAAHEFGHLLGLDDGYYNDATGVDRFAENAETTTDGENNVMKDQALAGFVTANDVEMALQTYRRAANTAKDNRWRYEAYNRYPQGSECVPISAAIADHTDNNPQPGRTCP